MSLPNKLAFVDVETTGTSLRFDRVIEIGVIRAENNKIVSTFNSLVNPQRYIPTEIQLLTGINSQDLENAPSFYSLKNEILRILKDCVFVAHNVRFDYSFIKNELKQFDIDFNPKQICTVKLAKKLYPKLKHHNLDTLIEKFNLICKKRHRALDDANCLWQFYQIIQKEFSKEQLMLFIGEINKKPALPINLAEEITNELPSSPGVYIFYGQNGMPLYIGKSVNIKKRIFSHFSADHLNSIEMKIAQQVQNIETVKTSGELGALLLESKLVKKLQPLYNRMLRIKRRMVYLKIAKNEKGYNQALIQQSNQLEVDSFDQVLGIFKSAKQAKNFLISLAKEYKLCEKLFGLENLAEECFGYRLGRCKGACRGKENHKIYNLRFQMAFAKYKLRSWPFDGKILIEEKDEENESFQQFLVDKWCILSKEEEIDSTLPNQAWKADFDYDTYKILEKYIRSPKNQKNIKSLS